MILGIRTRHQERRTKIERARILSALQFVLLNRANGAMIWRLAFTCKTLNEFCFGKNMSRGVWRHALFMDYPHVLRDTFPRQYFTLYCANLTKRLRGELFYLYAYRDMMHAIQSYSSSGTEFSAQDVVGMIANLISFDRIDVAKCLSLVRPQAMNIVVMSSHEALLRFKHSRRNGVSVPFNVSYISLDSCFDELRTRAGHLISPRALPEIEDRGFVGYAYRLARLRPEHEYLRNSVLWTIFRDLAIFERESQGAAYARRHSCWHVGLDFCPIEVSPARAEVVHQAPRFASRKFRPLSQYSLAVDTRIRNTRRAVGALRGGLISDIRKDERTK